MLFVIKRGEHRFGRVGASQQLPHSDADLAQGELGLDARSLGGVARIVVAQALDWHGRGVLLCAELCGYLVVGDEVDRGGVGLEKLDRARRVAQRLYVQLVREGAAVLGVVDQLNHHGHMLVDGGHEVGDGGGVRQRTLQQLERLAHGLVAAVAAHLLPPVRDVDYVVRRRGLRDDLHGVGR
eukprot:2938898-Pleurochrysis_carterae.AAC.1